MSKVQGKEREPIDFEREERERVISASAREEDSVVDLTLRPGRLGEFVGQIGRAHV